MVFSEVLEALSQRDIDVTVTQLRWAITSGKIPRPPLDGSHNFRFEEEHVEKLAAHFSRRADQKRPAKEGVDA